MRQFALHIRPVFNAVFEWDLYILFTHIFSNLQENEHKRANLKFKSLNHQHAGNPIEIKVCRTGGSQSRWDLWNVNVQSPQSMHWIYSMYLKRCYRTVQHYSDVWGMAIFSFMITFAILYTKYLHAKRKELLYRYGVSSFVLKDVHLTNRW